MAFKNNSVPSFVERHDDTAEIPGYAVPTNASVQRHAPEPFAGTSFKGWDYVECAAGDQSTLQANANEIWRSLQALAGLIAAMNTVTPGPYQDYDYGNTATSFGLASVSGGGDYATAQYSGPAGSNMRAMTGGLSLPCLLLLDNSKLTGCGGHVVYRVDDSGTGPGGVGTLTLYLMNPCAGRAMVPAVAGNPISGTLLGYFGPAREQWPALWAGADPRVAIEALLYATPYRKEHLDIFGSDWWNFTISRLGTNIGHPSLSSLVGGVPDAAPGRYHDRKHPGSSGWSKARTITGAQGQSLNSSVGGFEFIHGTLDFGPAGGTRQTSRIDFANLEATADYDPDKKQSASVLRGLQSQHVYTRAVSGGQGPIIFNRTWLLFPKLPTADGEYSFPDGKVINGYWNSLGRAVAQGDPGVVASRLIEIRAGIRATKAAGAPGPAPITTVRIGAHQEGLTNAWGGTVALHLRHGSDNFAIPYQANEEDLVQAHTCAGLKVLPRADRRWTNYASACSVVGQGGNPYIQAGHCLQVPAHASIPAHLQGRLLPIVRAEAGAGNADPGFDTGFLSSGAYGMPADFAQWGGKMDVIWLRDDGGNTWGQILAAGVDVAALEWTVVRCAVASAVHAVHAVDGANPGQSFQSNMPLVLPASGRIYLEDRYENLAVDLDQWVEQAPPSVSGDKILQVAENIFTNGYAFDFQTGPFTAENVGHELEAWYDASSWAGYPSSLLGWQPNGSFVWIEGHYKFTYTRNTGYTTTTSKIGCSIDSEYPALISRCVYFNPKPTFIAPLLQRSPVGADGIASAVGNMTIGSPSLVTQHAWDDGHYWHFDPLSTNTAPALSLGLIGVNQDGTTQTMATLTMGGEAAPVTGGVPVMVDLTEVASKIVERRSDFDCFALFPVAEGFTSPPGTEIGPKFMKALWERFYTRGAGEVTAKYIIFESVAVQGCHVGFKPAAFELPADCRV